jgi:hypothetical protein
MYIKYLRYALVEAVVEAVQLTQVVGLVEVVVHWHTVHLIPHQDNYCKLLLDKVDLVALLEQPQVPQVQEELLG